MTGSRSLGSDHRGTPTSPMRVALTGGAWALGGTTIGRLANVGALLLAARQLGSEQFGGISLSLATVAVVMSVSALGLPVAAQKLVAESRENDCVRAGRLIDTTLVVTTAIGLCTMTAVLLNASAIASDVLGLPELAPAVVVVAVLVVLSPLVELCAALLAALERFRLLGIYRAVHGGVAAVAIVVVLWATPSSVSALWAIAGSEALTCGIGWFLVGSARGTGHRVRGPASAVWPPVRSLLRVSLPAMVASVSLQPALWFGQLLLSRGPRGLEQVGVFAVAMRWHAIALFVPATMGSVLLPMLGRLRASGRDRDARDLFVRYGGLTLVFAAGAGLLTALLARPLMGVQGAEYLVGTSVLVVLAVAMVPTAVNNVLSQRALAENRLALWVWSDIALAVALTVAAVMLVPALGAVGLAWSYLLAYFVTCCVLAPVVRAARREAVA